MVALPALAAPAWATGELTAYALKLLVIWLVGLLAGWLVSAAAQRGRKNANNNAARPRCLTRPPPCVPPRSCPSPSGWSAASRPRPWC